MEVLTPAERRGALVVLCLLALGTGRDLWRAGRPLPEPATRPGAERVAPSGDVGAARVIPSVPAGDPKPGESLILDLNRATASELDGLPGIGPVLADRIIAHRQRHGPFTHREELLAVRGIGPRLLARIGSRVEVGPPSTSSGHDSLRPAR